MRAREIPVHFRGKAALILLEQIRTLNKRRLIRRLNTISADALAFALTTLREIFDE